MDDHTVLRQALWDPHRMSHRWEKAPRADSAPSSSSTLSMDAFRKLSSSSRASAREQELITTEVSVESSSSCKGKEVDEAGGMATGQGLTEWAPQPAQTLGAEAAPPLPHGVLAGGTATVPEAAETQSLLMTEG